MPAPSPSPTPSPNAPSPDTPSSNPPSPKATAPDAPARTGRTGRPPRTSRGAILRAAWSLIERDGWERLTMRRLAAEAGTAPTTLYHHVRDKEDLLTQLLDDYAASVPRPVLPADPRERIVVAATAIHDALAAWPWLAEVVSADDPVGESAMWMIETIVAGAVECGCAPEDAVRVYRSVWYYTAGEILVRANAARRRAADKGPNRRDAVLRALDAEHFPQLAALADRWPELAARDTYAYGLRALLDGLLPR